MRRIIPFVLILIMITACKSLDNQPIGIERNTIEPIKSISPSPTLDIEAMDNFDMYLNLTRQELINKLGKEFKEGTPTLENSSLLFPILIYQQFGFTFVFGNVESNSKVKSIMINSDMNPENININGAFPGMNFEEVQKKLGVMEINKTWVGTEDDVSYKIEYLIEGLKYKFISVHSDGRSASLMITKQTSSNESQKENNYLIYENKALGFSIQFPNDWKGKYDIKENKKGITVVHKTNGNTEGQFFSISIYGTEASWNELLQTEEDGWPYKKLGVKDGMVFVKSGPSDEQYDTTTDDGKKWSKEYFKLLEQMNTIIASFKIIK